MAKGRGEGERAKEPLFLLLLSPSYSLPRLFSSVLHYAPLSTTPGTGSFMVGQRVFLMPMQGIYRCPFGRIWHFNSSYTLQLFLLSISKTPLFFYFPFRCRGKFSAICCWWWCFIVHRSELKYFLKRSLQSTFTSVIIVIYWNVHENSQEKRKCSY